MKSVRTRGFHQAAAIVPGTVIERVYFAIPSNIVPVIDIDNEQRPTMADALRRAIENAEATEVKHPGLIMRVTVDVRWVMKASEGTPASVGGSQDAVAERFTYDTIAEAQAHLDRIIKYAS